jgi:putative inorganic carbon (hco3(-)) transporter
MINRFAQGDSSLSAASENSGSNISLRWIYTLSAVFISSLCVAIYNDFLYALLAPLVLVVLWAAFFKLEYLILFVVMFTPISLSLEALDIGGIGMYLPTEPLLAGILVLFFFKVISGKSIDVKVFKHPLSYAIYAYLIWMALTCITSEYPLVSVKFLITRLWFIVAMYFIAAHMFRDAKKINWYLLFYLFPLFLVITYTVVRHAQHGFDKDSSHWVMANT